MSIVTKTGDDGSTGLMYNRRVPKSHPRVETYGAVDELNAALGMARAVAARSPWLHEHILDIQKDLVTLMGELATLPEDFPRYEKDGFPLLTAAHTEKLDALVREIESQNVSYKNWATPGANPAAAALDLARTVCRRAERRASALREASQLNNAQILIHLNRLSDTLWLLARWAEANESNV